MIKKSGGEDDQMEGETESKVKAMQSEHKFPVSESIRDTEKETLLMRGL